MRPVTSLSPTKSPFVQNSTLSSPSEVSPLVLGLALGFGVGAIALAAGVLLRRRNGSHDNVTTGITRLLSTVLVFVLAGSKLIAAGMGLSDSAQVLSLNGGSPCGSNGYVQGCDTPYLGNCTFTPFVDDNKTAQAFRALFNASSFATCMAGQCAINDAILFFGTPPAWAYCDTKLLPPGVPTNCTVLNQTYNPNDLSFAESFSGILTLSNATTVDSCDPRAADLQNNAWEEIKTSTAYTGGGLVILFASSAIVTFLMVPMHLVIALTTKEHCTMAPWRGHWDDVTRFPKTMVIEAVASATRVAVALYFLLGYGAPLVFASKVTTIFALVVVFDTGSFVTLKRILRPRRVEEKANVVAVGLSNEF